MANVRGGRSGEAFGDRKRSHNHVVEAFDPSSGWIEDSDHHLLLVDLPGFKKEEVKLQVLGSGDIVIAGERQVNENKWIYFEKTMKLPENSDVEKITGKFTGEILYITVEKKERENKKPTISGAEIAKENSSGNEKEEEGGELPPENAMTAEERESFWRRHRGIIVTALVAFSIGVLVSQKIKLSRLTDATH